MKTKVILVSLFLAYSLGLEAQDATIVFEKIVHDFGTIGIKEDPVNYTFTFVNKGTTPIVIQDVKPSCDCAISEWSKTPVSAGGQGFVKVTYNPSSIGVFTKEIVVYSNAKPSLISLNILVQVVVKTPTVEERYSTALTLLRLSSNSLSLARMVQGSIKKDSLAIINTGQTTLNLSFKHVSPLLTVKSNPVTLPAGCKGFIIGILNTATNNKEWGVINVPVTVVANGKDIGKINFTATINDDFSYFTPADYAKAAIVSIVKSTFNFGKVTQGTSVSTVFQIKNTGKSDLIIRKVNIENKVLKVKAPTIIKPNTSSKIYITLDTKFEIGEKIYTITLTTNTPYSSLVTFTLTGIIES